MCGEDFCRSDGFHAKETCRRHKYLHKCWLYAPYRLNTPPDAQEVWKWVDTNSTNPRSFDTAGWYIMNSDPCSFTPTLLRGTIKNQMRYVCKHWDRHRIPSQSHEIVLQDVAQERKIKDQRSQPITAAQFELRWNCERMRWICTVILTWVGRIVVWRKSSVFMYAM